MFIVVRRGGRRRFETIHCGCVSTCVLYNKSLSLYAIASRLPSNLYDDDDVCTTSISMTSSRIVFFLLSFINRASCWRAENTRRTMHHVLGSLNLYGTDVSACIPHKDFVYNNQQQGGWKKNGWIGQVTMRKSRRQKSLTASSHRQKWGRRRRRRRAKTKWDGGGPCAMATTSGTPPYYL